MCPARLLRSLESSRVFLAELGVHVREVEAVVQVFVLLDEHFVEYSLKFFKAFAPGRRTPLFAFEAERGGHECHGFDSGFSGDPTNCDRTAAAGRSAKAGRQDDNVNALELFPW